ncbi:porin [Paraburkholderia lycopersici]|uniref:Outer membrane protein (Porin) n=1 Tax=Paraburkholderia lycopersici TaxID=416944 RepID=A0A1G6ZQN5_9BURK|nr:porin [Paraburkholderia lycopersici]SDE04693.1 Outer membrane protein (porin) [Paraburkholderia lycopersici]
MKGIMNNKITIFSGLLMASVGLASGTACASGSSVVLYGILDTSIEYLTNAGGTSSTPHSVLRETSGSWYSDRVGLKGTEDLGNGYAAIFTLESGFNIGNGALLQGGRLFGRQAFVGLDTPFGAVTFGRQKTVLYDYLLGLDPLSWSSYGLDDQDTQVVNRADNSVKYVTNIGPFNFDAMYSFGYDSVSGSGPLPGQFRVGKEYDIGGEYASGPATLAIIFEQRNGNSSGTGNQKEQRFVAAGSYAFSQMKFFGGYEWYMSSVIATAQHQNMFYAGAQYRVTVPLQLSAAIFYHDIRSADQRPVSFGVQADYALSKQTQLYIEGTYVKNSNGSDLGASGFGSSIVAGRNQTAVAAGIVHMF